MATYKTKDLERALEKKGFQRDNTHHSIWWYYLDGKKTSHRTRTSHSETEYDEFLFAQRRKQMGNLSKNQMLAFIDCPLTAESYKEILIETGIVTPRTETGNTGNQ